VAFPVSVAEWLTPVKWDTIYSSSMTEVPVCEMCEVTSQDVVWQVCGPGDLKYFALVGLS